MCICENNKIYRFLYHVYNVLCVQQLDMFNWTLIYFILKSLFLKRNVGPVALSSREISTQREDALTVGLWCRGGNKILRRPGETWKYHLVVYPEAEWSSNTAIVLQHFVETYLDNSLSIVLVDICQPTFVWYCCSPEALLQWRDT